MLVLANADLTQTSNNGIGPMFLAIKGGKFDVLQYLLDKNLPVYYPDITRTDLSPIFYAIKTGSIKAIELMCDKNINLDGYKNSVGFTPLTFAVSLNQDEIGK